MTVTEMDQKYYTAGNVTVLGAMEDDPGQQTCIKTLRQLSERENSHSAV